MGILAAMRFSAPTREEILSVLRLWALRIPLAYLFGYVLGWGADGVWWGMSLSNVVSGLGALALVASRSWQRTLVEERGGE